jgi:hypothetical protein
VINDLGGETKVKGGGTQHYDSIAHEDAVTKKMMTVLVGVGRRLREARNMCGEHKRNGRSPARR